MHDYGLHLLALRKEHGLTQEQLAKMLNVSTSTILRWELNYKFPGFDSLMRMASIYNVTLDYMAGLDTKRAIVTDRLTDQQIAILRSLVLEFQSSSPKSAGLTQRQQDILSSIFLAFDSDS